MASVAQTLVKIEIVDKPQTEYRYKKEFDKSGLTLLATYEYGGADWTVGAARLDTTRRAG